MKYIFISRSKKLDFGCGPAFSKNRYSTLWALTRSVRHVVLWGYEQYNRGSKRS